MCVPSVRQVREWQPSEGAAFAALAAEVASPEAAAAIAAADAPQLPDGAANRFPALMRDYAYETS